MTSANNSNNTVDRIVAMNRVISNINQKYKNVEGIVKADKRGPVVVVYFINPLAGAVAAQIIEEAKPFHTLFSVYEYD